MLSDEKGRHKKECPIIFAKGKEGLKHMQVAIECISFDSTVYAQEGSAFDKVKQMIDWRRILKKMKKKS